MKTLLIQRELPPRGQFSLGAGAEGPVTSSGWGGQLGHSKWCLCLSDSAQPALFTRPHASQPHRCALTAHLQLVNFWVMSSAHHKIFFCVFMCKKRL